MPSRNSLRGHSFFWNRTWPSPKSVSP
jgi:hypothetical protein